MLKTQNRPTCFYRGWMKAPQGQIKEVKKEIMEFFAIGSEPSLACPSIRHKGTDGVASRWRRGNLQETQNLRNMGEIISTQ